MENTLRKRVKGKSAFHLPKKQNTNTPTEELKEPEESQWIANTGRTSFVWKFFQAKTDGRAYCKYINNNSINNEECGYSCIYKVKRVV